MIHPCPISVVIPTCDRSEMLRSAIDSVLRQSRAPLEIIVVNNGKEELSPTAMPSHVKAIRIEPYAGVSRARNAGASVASGEYIAFLDDDDRWDPDYLLHAEHIIQHKRPDLILATLNWLSEDRILHTRCLPSRYEDGEMLLGCYVTGSNTTVRKDAFMRAGGYDVALSWGEDMTLALVMHSQNARIVSSSNMHALYYQHTGTRLSAGGTHKMMAELFKRNSHLLSMRYRIYCKMRIARWEAREKHSIKHYIISKIYRLIYIMLSIAR